MEKQVRNLKLTIAIPTFNRLTSLRAMLEPVFDLLKTSDADVEILVVDNASTDGTADWLDSLSFSSLNVEKNHVNIGIEGNIILALLHSRGEYIWLLSDHMAIDLRGLKRLLGFLDQGIEFDLAYARVAQYPSLFPSVGNLWPLGKIESKTRAQVPVIMSNISTIIVRCKALMGCFRSVFRYSGFSYPHLGIFAHFDAESRVMELPVMTSFASGEGTKRRVSYDMFRSRFLGLPRALCELARQNCLFKESSKALYLHRGALTEELALGLFFRQEPGFGATELLECCRYYHGLERILVGGGLTCLACPGPLRQTLGQLFLKSLFPTKLAFLRELCVSRYADEAIRE